MAKQYTDEDLKRYYSIGEVAKILGVSTTKIRYWDKEFPHLKPNKNSRGDRRFTKDNLAQLRQIHHLVSERGFTLEGARREIASGKATTAPDHTELIASLLNVRAKLEAMLK